MRYCATMHIIQVKPQEVFQALADPTRRAILARLALGETSVSELAEPFDISLPAVSRHLKVLEHAGQKNVKLGFENREKFEELPLDADYADFLAGLPAGAPVGYWHDTGHADIKESMGLLNHRQHLETRPGN